MTKRIFILAHQQARTNAARYIAGEAPDGDVVVIRAATRTIEQNSKFHAICGDLARSKFPWRGKPRALIKWKLLLISGHAIATKEEVDIEIGLEGEYINLRESTALMSVRRGASLITYALAFCDLNGIELSETIENTTA